ncbi:MAG: YgfZ/GcvT domain-containing protein [Terriglobales bacterium]
MKISPLAPVLDAQSFRLNSYRGAQVLGAGAEDAIFAPWPQQQVLLYDAAWRSLLVVEGPEARKWLNGMITANVRDLATGTAAPSFQLDPKGHILATLDIACTAPDQFLLLSDEIQRESLLERLRKYVFVSKLTIRDESASWSALRLRGPAATAAAQTAGWCDAPPAALSVAPSPAGGWVLASAPLGVAQLEWLAPAGAIAAQWPRLQSLATSAGAAAQERDRIFSCQPLFGTDITGAELPQETGQTDCLSFTKGCYIGQEIVERIRARGAVHRRWSAFRFDAEVAPGAAIEAQGRALGQLTSAAAEPKQWFALGYVRDLQPGAAVTAGGITGRLLEQH